MWNEIPSSPSCRNTQSFWITLSDSSSHMAEGTSKESRQAQPFPIGQQARTKICLSMQALFFPLYSLGKVEGDLEWWYMNVYDECIVVLYRHIFRLPLNDPESQALSDLNFYSSLKCVVLYFSLSSTTSCNSHFLEIENVYWSFIKCFRGTLKLLLWIGKWVLVK